MMMVVGDKRGIVNCCPVIRMIAILASRSPIAAAVKRDMFIGLHADMGE